MEYKRKIPLPSQRATASSFDALTCSSLFARCIFDSLAGKSGHPPRQKVSPEICSQS